MIYWLWIIIAFGYGLLIGGLITDWIRKGE